MVDDANKEESLILLALDLAFFMTWPHNVGICHFRSINKLSTSLYLSHFPTKMYVITKDTLSILY